MNDKATICAVGTAPPLVDKGLNEHFTVVREANLEVRGIAVCGGHTRIDNTFVELFPRLEIVSSFGVGYDHIDAAALARRGIVVTHTPDVLTGEVADLALGLLIATVRQLPQVDRYLREGKWLERPYPLTATLRGRKVGILGLGRIGKAIARRLEACELEIEYHGRKPQPDVAYRYHPTLLGLAQSCDVLMVVASVAPRRGTSSTRTCSKRWVRTASSSTSAAARSSTRRRWSPRCATGRSCPSAWTCSRTSRACRPS